jgi:hypothetical protein
MCLKRPQKCYAVWGMCGDEGLCFVLRICTHVYMKNKIFAVLGIFVVWNLVDMLVHGHLLMGAYTATAQLWRPMEEMNQGLMQLTTFLGAVVFTWMYACAVSNKALCKGVCLGLQVGLFMAVLWGVGSYAYMPITLNIVAGWCGDMLAKGVLAGVIVGKLVHCDVGCSKKECV